MGNKEGISITFSELRAEDNFLYDLLTGKLKKPKSPDKYFPFWTTPCIEYSGDIYTVGSDNYRHCRTLSPIAFNSLMNLLKSKEQLKAKAFLKEVFDLESDETYQNLLEFAREYKTPQHYTASAKPHQSDKNHKA